MSAYGVSKLGMVRFTEGLAAETRAYGLSAFAVFPGSGYTAMAEEHAASMDSPWVQAVFRSAEYLRENWRIPAERPAALCRFLASGAADALSGRVFDVLEDEQEVVGRAVEIEKSDLYAFRLKK